MARRQLSGDRSALPPEEELKQLALGLDLTGLAEAYPKSIVQAEQDKCSYTELVLRLLRTEAAQRKSRAEERARRSSGLGPPVDLTGFDYSIRPGLEAKVLQELHLCRFVLDGRGLVLVGASGTGKTRVSLSLGHAALRLGHTVLYRTAAAAVEELASALVDGTYLRTLRRLAKPDVLVLDEFGAVSFDKNAARHLFRLVSERYQKRSTIVAANTGFKKWKTFFPSEAECVATVDRLVDRATILRFSGPSWRGPDRVLGEPLPDDDCPPT